MYTSLSNYLNNAVSKPVDTNINEGIFDIFKGKQGGAAKGFFGILGSMFSAITGNKDDDLTKALKDQERKAEENAKKREEDLAKSAEGALIAKLNADFEQKENQLKLANDQRISAYNAQKRQFKEDADFWKNNKRQYTAEQLDGFNRARQQAYEGLGAIGGNELGEFNQLFDILTTDENGYTLSIEEIQTKAQLKEGDQGYDSEFAANYKRFNELGNKFKKPMLEGAKSNEYYEEMGKVPMFANEYNEAQTILKEKEEAAADYEKKSKQVATFNAKKKAHEEANEKLNTAKAAVTNFGSDSNGLCSVDGNGDIVIDITKIELTPAIPNEGTEEQKTQALDDHINKLKELGIPQDILDNAIAAYENNTSNSEGVDAFKQVLNASDVQDRIKESVKKQYQEKYEAAQLEVTNAEAEVGINPEPDINDPAYADIKDLSDKQKMQYDTTTDVGKKIQTSIKDELSDAQSKMKTIEKDRTARAAKRQAVKEEYTATQKSKIPEELQADVNRAKQGIELGETKQNGKVGIKLPDGTFMEKPGPNASEEENKKYDNARDAIILSKPIKDLKPVEIKNEGGKYYMVDGDSKVEISKEDAIQAYADNAIEAEQRANLLGKKQAYADNITKCIKDGDLDIAAYKALSPAEKETMKKILSGEIQVEEVFKGVDMSGSATIDKVTAFKKSHDELDDKESFDEYIKDIDAADNDELESGEDSDADHDADDVVDDKDFIDDNEELETDEDEEYTDDEGDTQTRKKKLKNPAKIWRRKKKKNGKGVTSSYYNKEGDSISKKEFKKRMATYKEALKKKKEKQNPTNTDTTTNTSGNRPLGDPDLQSRIDYTNLSNWLFEKLLNNI